MVQHAYMRAARARAFKRLYKSARFNYSNSSYWDIGKWNIFSPAERGRHGLSHGPYARGRGAWAAACVAVAFRIAWPPLWVDTEPALPRPRSPALRTNTHVLESELAASSRRWPIYTVSVYFCRSSI